MLFTVRTFDDVPYTFWNPLDYYAVTLSNLRQTVTSTGDTYPHAGWQNLEISTGKYYFEIDVQKLVTGRLNTGLICGWRNVYDGFHPTGNSYYTQPIYIDPVYHQLTAWNSDVGTLVSVIGKGMSADATGSFGYAQGDRLMFAIDRDNNKAWIGKNGTWMNSGDPAAGTNPQYTGFLAGRAYRFYIQGSNQNYSGANEMILNACFGSSRFPQLYTAPTGFESVIPRAEVQQYGGWNVRQVTLNGRQGTENLTNDDWLRLAKLFTTGDPGAAVSVGRMHTGGKYYVELYIATFTAAEFYFGIAQLGAVDDLCTWRSDGTLATTGGITANSTGVGSFAGAGLTVGFAVDVDAGKVWLRNTNGSWANGDPSSGTGEQFSGLPVETLTIYGEVAAYSGGVQMPRPADYVFATPTGFEAGLPLHPVENA